MLPLAAARAPSIGPWKAAGDDPEQLPRTPIRAVDVLSSPVTEAKAQAARSLLKLTSSSFRAEPLLR
ncbi:hypothetical protein BE21_03945 [Sorangium cellulosum]|uniref:Uncharacterized protein n=1 Tax=Sorangium cellulosum TaxID=56 RepID=A0A150TIY3_SORCE|nr:hypothetical protein BE21_03945 [Sorangium cellulosum]